MRLRQNSDLDTLQEANSRQTKEIQLNTLKKENQVTEMKQEIQRKNEEFRDLLQEKTQKEIELEQVVQKQYYSSSFIGVKVIFFLDGSTLFD